MASAATPETAGSTATTLKKSYKFYDDSLSLVSKEVDINFTPATAVADAMSRLANSEALILKALNAQLLKLTVSEARKTAVSGGLSKKIVLNTIKPFRGLPPWSAMVDETATGPVKAESRRKQTAALLELVKSSPVILEAIKAASSSATDEDEDEDESGDE